MRATSTGSYVFRTYSDDGVRLWVNGVQVINNWIDHGLTANDSAAISLTANVQYNIVMEYYERGGGATARLQWKTPGAAKFLSIPLGQLSPLAGVVANGTYRIMSRASSKAADIYGGSTADGARVFQQTYVGVSSQRWNFEHRGGNVYKITANHSGKALTVEGAVLGDGGKIIQYSFSNNGVDNDLWTLTSLTGGYFRFTGNASGKVLDVPGGSTASGVELQQYTSNGTSAQQWQILAP